MLLVAEMPVAAEPLMAVQRPVFEERKPARVDLPAWAVECAFRSGHWVIRWRPLHIPEGIDCRIDAFDAAAADFHGRHERTRTRSPFNH